MQRPSHLAGARPPARGSAWGMPVNRSADTTLWHTLPHAFNDEAPEQT